MGYDLYRINLVYSVVRTVSIPMLKSFLQGFDIQFNLSTPDTLGQKRAAVVERFKQESTYGLSAKRVAVVERWPREVRL